MTVSYLENIEFKFKNINNEKVILLIFKNWFFYYFTYKVNNYIKTI